ncbi:MAG: hypothetical protein U0163_05550 [Gemmatimonadaceae bacterium]
MSRARQGELAPAAPVPGGEPLFAAARPPRSLARLLDIRAHEEAGPAEQGAEGVLKEFGLLRQARRSNRQTKH